MTIFLTIIGLGLLTSSASIIFLLWWEFKKEDVFEITVQDVFYLTLMFLFGFIGAYIMLASMWDEGLKDKILFTTKKNSIAENENE